MELCFWFKVYALYDFQDKPERGWGMLPDDSSDGRTSEEFDALKARVTFLEEKLEAALGQKEELPVEEA
jgi:hypothetical protein